MKKILLLLILLCIGIAVKAQNTVINATGARLEFNQGDTDYSISNQDNFARLVNGNLNLRAFNNILGGSTVSFKRIILNTPVNISQNRFLNIKYRIQGSLHLNLSVRMSLILRIYFRNGNSLDSSEIIQTGLSQDYFDLDGNIVTNYSLEHIPNLNNVVGLSINNVHLPSISSEAILSYIQLGEPLQETLPVQSNFGYFNDFNNFLSNRVSTIITGTPINEFNGTHKLGTLSTSFHYGAILPIHYNIHFNNPITVLNSPSVRFKIKGNNTIRINCGISLQNNTQQHLMERTLNNTTDWTWVSFVGNNARGSSISSVGLNFGVANDSTGKIEIDSLYINGFINTDPTLRLYPYNDSRVLTQGRVKEIPSVGYLANNALVSHSIRTTADYIIFKIKPSNETLRMPWGSNEQYFDITVDNRFYRRAILNANDTTISIYLHNATSPRNISITRLSSTGTKPHLFEGVYTLMNDSIITHNNNNQVRKILFISDHIVEGNQFHLNGLPGAHPVLENPLVTYPAIVSNRLNAQLHLVSNNFATLHSLPANQVTNLNRLLSVSLPNVDIDTLPWPVDYSNIHTVIIDLNRRDHGFNPISAQGTQLNFRRRVKQAYHITRAAYPLAQIILSNGIIDNSIGNINQEQAFRNGYEDYINETNDSRACVYIFRFNPNSHQPIQAQMADGLINLLLTSDSLNGGNNWHFNRNRRIEVLRRNLPLVRNGVNFTENPIQSYQVVGHNNSNNINLSTHSNIGLSTSPSGSFHNTLTLPNVGGLVYVRYNVAQENSESVLEILHENNSETIRLPILMNSITSSEQALESSLQLYPNPSNGVVKIQFDNSLGELKTLAVSNSIGQVVYEEQSATNASELKELNLSHLAKGLYTLTMQIGGQSIRKQIVLK